MTSFRSTYQKVRPTKIRYRSYKTFDENAFLTDLRTCPFHECLKLSDPERAYENFKQLYLDITNKHAPVKTKMIRGNNAPLMNKELSKEIIVKSKLRNKLYRHKTKTNWKNYTKQHNKCRYLRREAVILHFSKLCKNGVISDKKFWSTIKPFMNNKGYHGNNNLTLYEDDNIAKDETEVSGILNNFYINIVNHVTGKERDGLDLNDLADFQSNEQILEQTKEKYSTHPGIKRIKDKLNDSSSFSFREVTTDEIIKIIKALDINSATGIDTIPHKLVVMSSDATKKTD